MTAGGARHRRDPDPLEGRGFPGEPGYRPTAAERRGGPGPDLSGTPTKGDTDRARTAARKADRDRAAAYRAGKEGRPLPDRLAGDAELQDLHHQGSGERPSWARRQATSAGRSIVSSVGTDDLAGMILGVLGYVLTMNYLRGGPQQVRGWFAAKFLNRPYAPATPLPLPSGRTAPSWSIGAAATAPFTPGPAGAGYSTPSTDPANPPLKITRGLQ